MGKSKRSYLLTGHDIRIGIAHRPGESTETSDSAKQQAKSCAKASKDEEAPQAPSTALNKKRSQLER